MIRKEACIKVPINPIILGRLGAVHGIRGWLKIFPYTEHAKDIFKYQPWFIQRSGQWQQLELENWKQHNRCFIIKIKHSNDRNTASLITNYEVIVDLAQLPKLKDNEFYWKNLIGCQVLTTKGYSLGYVQSLIETGSNDVLVIKANLKDAFGIKERLIPIIDEQVIKNINFSSKIIEVDWHPGF